MGQSKLVHTPNSGFCLDTTESGVSGLRTIGI